MSEDEERKIVDVVLEKHGMDDIAVYLKADLADCLADASSDEALSVHWERVDAERHELAEERAKLISRLLDTYSLRQHRTLTRIALKEDHDIDIQELLSDFSKLMVIEGTIAAEPFSKRRNRPPTAKNESAATMFKILLEAAAVPRNKQGAWTASGIVADMFIEAAVEDRPKKNVQQSLYDKLVRPLR